MKHYKVCVFEVLENKNLEQKRPDLTLGSADEAKRWIKDHGDIKKKYIIGLMGELLQVEEVRVRKVWKIEDKIAERKEGK